jgi:hypothetical protein
VPEHDPLYIASRSVLLDALGAPAAVGVRMASNALRVAVPPQRVEGVCMAFVREVRIALEAG